MNDILLARRVIFNSEPTAQKKTDVRQKTGKKFNFMKNEKIGEFSSQIQFILWIIAFALHCTYW